MTKTSPKMLNKHYGAYTPFNSPRSCATDDLTHREFKLALLLAVPTTGLLLLPKLAWLDNIHHVYLRW